MPKSCNHWIISLLIAVWLSSCGIFHFADPVAMEGSPSDLSGVKDLIEVHSDAGTEPMGFCAKEGYALKGRSSKVLACWDGNFLPSLAECDASKWKVYPFESSGQSSWGFASTFSAQVSCFVSVLDLMTFKPGSTAIVKILHQRTMPPKDSNPSLYEYQLLLIPSGNNQPSVPFPASWKSGMDAYAVEQVEMNLGPSMTSWRGIEFKSIGPLTPGAGGVPGWLIRGLAIIQK